MPEELVAQARINFAKQFKDNSKKSANTLQRVFRGHIARSDYHELDKRRVNATSNLAQLSKTALKQSNLDAINPQQMVLRSGAETGTTPRLAAFRETHPQTIALQNKISDLKRGKGTGDLKQLQEQLQAAKKDEGVGQAKRGRPAGSKNVKK